MKAFDWECPKCKSLCQDRIVMIGYHPYSNTFSALFCTNSGCAESHQRGWYDCDDTVGIDKDRCVKKIILIKKLNLFLKREIKNG